MKIFRYLFLVFLVTNVVLYAQTPQKVSYQSVIRNGSGELVMNSNVGIRISIIQGSIFGTSVYVETHSVTTNGNGLATVEFGGGSVVTGSITTIDWSNGPFFLKTETDLTGGTAYSITGTTELISVPYSLYSQRAAVADSVVNISVGHQRAYVYLTKKATVQNVLTNTNTQITNYDSVISEDFTVNTTTGVVTFQRSGYYSIFVQTSFGAINQGRKLLWLNCTSTLWPERIASNEMSGDANRITTSFMGYFNAGDQLSMGVAQFTGVTVPVPNTTQDFDETYLNIELLFE